MKCLGQVCFFQQSMVLKTKRERQHFQGQSEGPGSFSPQVLKWLKATSVRKMRRREKLPGSTRSTWGRREGTVGLFSPLSCRLGCIEKQGSSESWWNGQTVGWISHAGMDKASEHIVVSRSHASSLGGTSVAPCRVFPPTLHGFELQGFPL